MACVLCIVQFLLLRPLAALAVAPEVIWLSLLNATLCTFAPVLMVMMAIERIGAAVAAQTGMVGPLSTIADGRGDPRRAVHRLDRRRHGAGADGDLACCAEIGDRRDGSRNRRQVGAGLRGEQGPGQGLRGGAGATRASTSSITARGADALQATAAELRALGRGEVRAVAGDITTAAGRAAALAACPQVDILVNNAGGPPPGDFRDWDRDAWIKALDANMLTPIELIKATVDAMAERGFGRIVNITSASVKAPIDVLGLSNGARSGLTGFVAGLARSSIAGAAASPSTACCPAPFDTDRVRTVAAARPSATA